MARSMLIYSKLPLKYYSEAILTASYFFNRVTHWKNVKTPYELMFNRKPRLDHLQRFGTVFLLSLQRKSGIRAKCSRLLGYGDDDELEEIKGYKVLKEKDNSIFYSNDVIFNSENFFENLEGYEPYDSDQDMLTCLGGISFEIDGEDTLSDIPDVLYDVPADPMVNNIPSEIFSDEEEFYEEP
jgi:hypothetical protein